MTFTVLIAEDEPLAREILRDWIALYPELVLVGEAADGRQAKSMIDALRPDLVFMDIQMPELTGLDVVRQITHRPALIFTTAYDQHAVTAFELNATDYLLKPFSKERFNAAVLRFIDEKIKLHEPIGGADNATTIDSITAAQSALQSETAQSKSPLNRILVRDRGRIFPLALSEIEYLKADTKYTLIVARGSSYLVRVSLTDLELRLDLTQFVRIHRSVIVNMVFVDSMRADEQSQLQIQMRDGTQLLANREASKMLRDWSV